MVTKGEANSLDIEAAKSKIVDGPMPRLDLPLEATADAALVDREKLQIDPGEQVFRKDETSDLKLEVTKSQKDAEPRPSSQVPVDTTKGVAIAQQPNLSVDQGNRVFSKGESSTVQYNRTSLPNSERKKPRLGSCRY